MVLSSTAMQSSRHTGERGTHLARLRHGRGLGLLLQPRRRLPCGRETVRRFGRLHMKHPQPRSLPRRASAPAQYRRTVVVWTRPLLTSFSLPTGLATRCPNPDIDSLLHASLPPATSVNSPTQCDEALASSNVWDREKGNQAKHTPQAQAHFCGAVAGPSRWTASGTSQVHVSAQCTLTYTAAAGCRRMHA